MVSLSIAAGLVLLFVGGELVVRGAVAVAQRYRVSPLVIGLTIVGFGTSLPELVVTLNAAVVGSTGLAVGNIVGSNMANMMLILGMAALIFPIAVTPDAVRRDGLFMVGVTVLFVALGMGGQVDWFEGVALVALLVSYIGYSLWRDNRANDATASLHREEAEELTGLPGKLWSMTGSILAGFVALVFGAEWLVYGATKLARGAGISDEVIGLTLVAVGTSLPELATSIVAAYRGHSDVCLGNVLGSNIFNLLCILGIVSIVTPVPFAEKILEFDLWALLIVSVLLIPFMLSGGRISRLEGIFLLACYTAYVGFQFLGFGGAMAGTGAG